jgi:hypothetical protein
VKDLLDRLWRWQCGFCIQYRSGLSASCGGCLVAAPVAQGAQQLCLVYEEFNFLRIVQLAVQRLHGNFMRCWSAAIAEPATAEWGPQLCHSHSGVGSLPKNAPMKPQSRLLSRSPWLGGPPSAGPSIKSSSGCHNHMISRVLRLPLCWQDSANRPLEEQKASARIERVVGTVK